MTRTANHAEKARQEKRRSAEAIGIDPALVSQMVDIFYAKVRQDDLLGPIFERRVDDWPHHLGRMKAFWGSILHQSGGYSGNPMLKHVAIPAIAAPEFRRWLALFDQTLDQIETHPEARRLIAGKARTIADSLLTAIHIHRDGKCDPLVLKGQADVR